jgi:hypothetical protein
MSAPTIDVFALAISAGAKPIEANDYVKIVSIVKNRAAAFFEHI